MWREYGGCAGDRLSSSETMPSPLLQPGGGLPGQLDGGGLQDRGELVALVHVWQRTAEATEVDPYLIL